MDLLKAILFFTLIVAAIYIIQGVCLAYAHSVLRKHRLIPRHILSWPALLVCWLFKRPLPVELRGSKPDGSPYLCACGFESECQQSTDVMCFECQHRLLLGSARE